ncbi:unnamed protein product [Kuraishia capsulata CBS 1993]|uniref:Uncharacterized protein n=1 Tax=Kuraishia capsulata CBS 1993 TaxID=1382522 RepID=W6MWC8_9ASCO|nr:uncharacterized protein KUCA_T00003198001 [Kuraishia capsulata CBS 1993]CDK27220.1 unnamed protein product [Kuraishia capsulata CBS 1993]
MSEKPMNNSPLGLDWIGSPLGLILFLSFRSYLLTFAVQAKGPRVSGPNLENFKNEIKSSGKVRLAPPCWKEMFLQNHRTEAEKLQMEFNRLIERGEDLSDTTVLELCGGGDIDTDFLLEGLETSDELQESDEQEIVEESYESCDLEEMNDPMSSPEPHSNLQGLESDITPHVALVVPEVEQTTTQIILAMQEDPTHELQRKHSHTMEVISQNLQNMPQTIGESPAQSANVAAGETGGETHLVLSSDIAELESLKNVQVTQGTETSDDLFILEKEESKAKQEEPEIDVPTYQEVELIHEAISQVTRVTDEVAEVTEVSVLPTAPERTSTDSDPLATSSVFQTSNTSASVATNEIACSSEPLLQTTANTPVIPTHVPDLNLKSDQIPAQLSAQLSIKIESFHPRLMIPVSHYSPLKSQVTRRRTKPKPKPKQRQRPRSENSSEETLEHTARSHKPSVSELVSRFESESKQKRAPLAQVSAGKANARHHKDAWGKTLDQRIADLLEGLILELRTSEFRDQPVTPEALYGMFVQGQKPWCDLSQFERSPFVKACQKT